MMDRQEKNLPQIFSQHGQTKQLIKKVEYLTQLNTLLQTTIDASLAPHCRVANYRDQVLVIEVNSAAWATQLHYHIPELLFSLQKIPAFQSLKKITCYIKPQTAPKIKTSSKLFLSKENAELLRETADTINTPRLKLALKKLAEHA